MTFEENSKKKGETFTFISVIFHSLTNPVYPNWNLHRATYCAPRYMVTFWSYLAAYIKETDTESRHIQFDFTPDYNEVINY
jgi:hypothetical protein